MPAELVAIADAVAAALSAADLSLEFTAERSYRPAYDLADLVDTLRVSVVPQGRGATILDRGRLQREYLIDVAFLEKLTDLSDANLDALMALVEEVEALLLPKRLAAYPAALCVAAENVPAFSPELLEEFREFASVLTLTYRTWG